MRSDPDPPPAAASGRGAAAGVMRLHPDSPLRPPDWRWRRARYLFEEDARARRWDDAPVRRARDFLFALRRCRRRGDEGRLAERVPDVAGARALQLGEPHLRREVQARILAREPPADIAGKTATDPVAVAGYSQLFFDVSDRMGSPGYIIHQAVGLHRRPNEPDDGRILRLLGYLGGPLVVDALVGAETGIARPDNSGEVLAFLGRLTCQQLLIKSFRGVLTMSVDGRAGRALLRTWGRFAASERRLRRAAPTADDLLPRVELMVEHFPDLRSLTGGGRG